MRALIAERRVYLKVCKHSCDRCQDALLFARQSRKQEFENVFELKTRQREIGDLYFTSGLRVVART